MSDLNFKRSVTLAKVAELIGEEIRADLGRPGGK